MHSTYNEGKSAITERFIRTIKNKIYKYVTSISKNVYIDKLDDLNGEEIVGTFNEKELQKTNQKEFRIEKVIKETGDKLHVKWKVYNNLFNSWIDKKIHSINE